MNPRAYPTQTIQELSSILSVASLMVRGAGSSVWILGLQDRVQWTWSGVRGRAIRLDEHHACRRVQGLDSCEHLSRCCLCGKRGGQRVRAKVFEAFGIRLAINKLVRHPSLCSLIQFDLFHAGHYSSIHAKPMSIERGKQRACNGQACKNFITFVSLANLRHSFACSLLASIYLNAGTLLAQALCMSKRTTNTFFKFGLGFVTGAMLAVLTMGYLFVSTTVSYHSTLFQGQRVVINGGGRIPHYGFDASKLAGQ